MVAKKKDIQQPKKSENKTAHPGGRPTTYSEEMCNLICERVASHTYGLQKLCKTYDDLPDQSTVNLWRYKYPEFSDRYIQAKIKQADLLAEECLEIADREEGDSRLDEFGNEVFNAEYVARARLKVDTRKWLASKLIPKLYGVKQDSVTVIVKHEDLIKDLE